MTIASCGAVVLDRDGRLVGEGHNTVRVNQDPTSHGEVVAIREAWRQVGDRQLLRGGTVYTQLGFGRVVFAARGTDLVDMRERSLEIIAMFPWTASRTSASSEAGSTRPG